VWDNVGFDGPVLPRDLSFDVPDGGTPSNTAPGAVNLGWPAGAAHGAATVQTLAVPSSAIAAASSAIVTVEVAGGDYSSPANVTYSFNGNPAQTVAWPASSAYQWVGLALPVPLNEVVNGPNTISISSGSDIIVANVDLKLVGAGGVVNPPPTSSGMLRVASSPAVPTQILVDGQIADSWGLAWLSLPAGTHTVSFSHVQGYTEPAPQTVTVTAGGTTTVTGTFVPRGFLRVMTSPPVASEVTVDGNPADDMGVWTDMPVGTHQVCFRPVAGYTAPPCQPAAITAGTTTTVTGTFTANPGAPGQSGTGLLRVTTSPALPSQIILTPQGGAPFITDTWSLDWLQLAPGAYTVTFSHVPGYTEPAPQSVTVSAGATTTLTGTFTQRGTLRVTTSPALDATISVDGVAADNWGVWTDLPVGAHQVCFGAVAGHTTPACQTATVTGGNETDISGTYN